jgi:hypothetical protein
VAAVDAMTIRLHLRAMRVLAVVEDLPERPRFGTSSPESRATVGLPRTYRTSTSSPIMGDLRLGTIVSTSS